MPDLRYTAQAASENFIARTKWAAFAISSADHSSGSARGSRRVSARRGVGVAFLDSSGSWGSSAGFAATGSRAGGGEDEGNGASGVLAADGLGVVGVVVR